MIVTELLERIHASYLKFVNRAPLHPHQVSHVQAISAEIAQARRVRLPEDKCGIKHHTRNVVGIAPGVAKLVALQELQYVVLVYLFYAYPNLAVIDGLERNVHFA